MMGSEKREHVRVPVFLECRVEGVTGFALARVSDLSVTGCCIDTPIPIRVGTPVTMLVTLSGSPSRFWGQVVHTHRGLGFGMQFDQLPAERHDELQSFLEALNRQRALE